MASCWHLMQWPIGLLCFTYWMQRNAISSTPMQLKWQPFCLNAEQKTMHCFSCDFRSQHLIMSTSSSAFIHAKECAMQNVPWMSLFDIWIQEDPWTMTFETFADLCHFELSKVSLNTMIKAHTKWRNTSDQRLQWLQPFFWSHGWELKIQVTSFGEIVEQRSQPWQNDCHW